MLASSAMEQKSPSATAHPAGEEEIPHSSRKKTTTPSPAPMSVYAKGGRYQVQWDDSAPMTLLGQLVFFAQFLHAGGQWEDFCREAPFGFISPNAPTREDVLGSMALSILCSHTRYAPVNALRFDTVTPPMLGMHKVVSEDSTRRNLRSSTKLGRAAGKASTCTPLGSASCTMDPGHRHRREDRLWVARGSRGRLQPAQARTPQPCLPLLLDRAPASVFGFGSANRKQKFRRLRHARPVGVDRLV